ncbi:MAG: GDP-L-fucose synthase [Acidobacteria bacterium]|nr:GDP-L-fucose synthase [Acidobacteriota bacterium]
MFDTEARVYVAGHRGLVGSAIVRRLRQEGFERLLLPTRAQLDLRNQADVDAWFEESNPGYVFLAAGTVGGIWANATRPAEFIYDNLMIHATVVHAAYRHGATKLLYLGSSCSYPREAEQPMPEEALLTGPLEPTNEPYAMAKIAGIKLCQAYRRQYGCDFISVMPTNLYGPQDNFETESSHVIAALMRRFHDVRLSGESQVRVWGTGTARREFMYVDDLADACLFLMKEYSDEDHINIGTGQDLEIRELAEMIREIVFPGAEIRFEPDKPDGAPRKLLDASRLRALGWQPETGLKEGLRKTYSWFCENNHSRIESDKTPRPGEPIP